VPRIDGAIGFRFSAHSPRRQAPPQGCNAVMGTENCRINATARCFRLHTHRITKLSARSQSRGPGLRDHVLRGIDTSTKNDIDCDLLCYNICELIQSQCELGIETVFWANRPAPVTADILPMVRPS
jgi:hypothetical protein